MFSYSVKFVCGIQNAPPVGQPCTPVRQGAYATDINIHNFHPHGEPAVIEKRVMLLIYNGKPVGREPNHVIAQKFDERLSLPPETATMDDCCRLSEMLKLDPGRLNIGFLEFL